MSISTPVIAGNWKLNLGPGETTRYFDDFLDLVPRELPGTIVIFPPAVSLVPAQQRLGSDSNIRLGAQNVYWEGTGAFTGELSAPLARAAGATFALVGHSERRHLFGETDAETARKTRSVLDADLAPVLCVGETLDEREAGSATDVVERQLDAAIAGLDTDNLRRLLLAYEPVWAIGTGRTASPDDAAEMHAHLRSLLRRRLASTADDLPILYGGSVKPENAAALLRAPDVDGLLVGGASLDPASFASICAVVS